MPEPHADSSRYPRLYVNQLASADASLPGMLAGVHLYAMHAIDWAHRDSSININVQGKWTKKGLEIMFRIPEWAQAAVLTTSSDETATMTRQLSVDGPRYHAELAHVIDFPVYQVRLQEAPSLVLLICL